MSGFKIDHTADTMHLPMPSVSIIIPVYNAEKYLAECVESVWQQTFADFELLLIDDGSTDGSAALCDDFARRDSRVKVFHKPNGGVSSARNYGVSHASGKYVTFIDADDYIAADFLQKVVGEMEECGADLLVSGLTKVYYREQKIEKEEPFVNWHDKTYDRKKFLEGIWIDYPFINVLGPVAKVYRSDKIKMNKIVFPEDISNGEDMCFNFDYDAVCGVIHISTYSGYFYRIDNGKSLTHRFYDNMWMVFQRLYRKYHDLIFLNDCNDHAKTFFDKNMGVEAIYCIFHYFRFYRETTFSQRLNAIRQVAAIPHLSDIRLKNMKKMSQKLILMLLRMRCCLLVYMLFYFQMRRNHPKEISQK